MEELNIYDMPYGVARVVELLHKNKLEDAAELLQKEIKRKTAKAPKAKGKGRGRPAKTAKSEETSQEEIDPNPKAEKTSVAASVAKSKAKKTAKPKEAKAEVVEQDDAADFSLDGFEDDLDELDL